MSTFVGIVIIIFGILQIILFFKVWNMCNNVQKLTDHFLGDEEVAASFSNRIAAGDDSVEGSIRKQLAKDIEKLCRASEGVTEEDFARINGKTPEQAIADLKKKYKELFGKLNKPVPKELEKLHNIEDLWNWNAL